MKRYLAILAGIGFLVAGSSLFSADNESKEEAIKKDRKQLEGTWKITSLEENGTEPFGQDELDQAQVIIDAEGKVEVKAGTSTLQEYTTQIDPTKNPKEIDLIYTEGKRKGQTCLGIYEVEGDVYRTCRAQAGKSRPAELSAKAGSGHTYVVYKRAKSK